jgi:hypothetical protein
VVRSANRNQFPAFRAEALDDLFAVPFHAQINTHREAERQAIMWNYLRIVKKSDWR